MATEVAASFKVILVTALTDIAEISASSAKMDIHWTKAMPVKLAVGIQSIGLS